MRTSNWTRIQEYATCRKCGCDRLGWVKSRAGKWYLCETRDTFGHLQADRRNWHVCEERADPTPSKVWIEKIINAGYKTLALKCHPDLGGSTEDMQHINAAIKTLREIIQ